MMEERPIDFTEDRRFMMEFVSSRGEGLASAAAKARSMIRRF
jgi:hypothetical protein